jgi:hypothetical protein
MAIVSLNQYDPPTKSRAKMNPMTRPPVPNREPIPMIRAPIAARRTAVFTLFFMSFSLVRRRGAWRKTVALAHEKWDRAAQSQSRFLK